MQRGVRCGAREPYRGSVSRFGKEIPESTDTIRWEISRPSPTRSRQEEGDECHQVGPACQPARERRCAGRAQRERGRGTGPR